MNESKTTLYGINSGKVYRQKMKELNLILQQKQIYPPRNFNLI